MHKFEMNGNGDHQIILDSGETSSWKPYTSISRISKDNSIFIGASTYWEGVIPQVVKVDSQLTELIIDRV